MPKLLHPTGHDGMRPTLSHPPDLQYPELSVEGCELLSRLHWAQNLLAMATRHLIDISGTIPTVAGEGLVLTLKSLFLEDPDPSFAAHAFKDIEDQITSESWVFTPEEGL